MNKTINKIIRCPDCKSILHGVIFVYKKPHSQLQIICVNKKCSQYKQAIFVMHTKDNPKG